VRGWTRSSGYGAQLGHPCPALARRLHRAAVDAGIAAVQRVWVALAALTEEELADSRPPRRSSLVDVAAEDVIAPQSNAASVGSPNSEYSLLGNVTDRCHRPRPALVRNQANQRSLPA
jgi:hypothetical protein